MTTREFAVIGALALGGLAACSLDDRTLAVHPALDAAGGTGGSKGGAGGEGGQAGNISAGGSSGGASGGSGGALGGSSGAAGAGVSGGNGGGAGDNTGGSSGTAGSAGDAGSSGSGGSGGGGILFLDDFEDGEPDGWGGGVNEGGQPLGTWLVTDTGSGHVFHNEAVTTLSWSIGGNVSWTNYRVEADCQFVTIAEPVTTGCYLAIRYLDYFNLVYLYYQADGSLYLVLGEAGSFANLGAVGKTPPVIGTWYELSLTVNGTAIQASLNGVQELTGTTLNIPSGGIAVGARDGVVRWDNVTVTAVP